MRRIGEDVTETLDYVPGRFKSIRHVREKLSCRACDTVIAAPAPDHAIARGRAGAGLLAHIVVSKFDDHLPLYRQAEIFAREGVSLETSTLSGWVGATAAALKPLVDALAADVMGSDTLHVDDTPVPVSGAGDRQDQDRAAVDLSMDGPRVTRVLLVIRHGSVAAIYPAFDAASAAGLDEVRGSVPNYVGGHVRPDRSIGFGRSRSDRLSSHP